MSYRLAFPARSWIEDRAKLYCSGSRAKELLLQVACCFSRAGRIKPQPQRKKGSVAALMVGLAQPHEEEEQLLCNRPSQRVSHEQPGYLPSFFLLVFYSAYDHISIVVWKQSHAVLLQGQSLLLQGPLHCLLAAAESPPCLSDLAAVVPKLCWWPLAC